MAYRQCRCDLLSGCLLHDAWLIVKAGRAGPTTRSSSASCRSSGPNCRSTSGRHPPSKLQGLSLIRQRLHRRRQRRPSWASRIVASRLGARLAEETCKPLRQEFAQKKTP
eukprot:scaffold198966_cov29-Prasinocladus_malaysianus.AAC.1